MLRILMAFLSMLLVYFIIGKLDKKFKIKHILQQNSRLRIASNIIILGFISSCVLVSQTVIDENIIFSSSLLGLGCGTLRVLTKKI